jgi:hypothetical protein
MDRCSLWLFVLFRFFFFNFFCFCEYLSQCLRGEAFVACISISDRALSLLAVIIFDHRSSPPSVSTP